MFTALPDYAVIRISKKQQQDKREKIGSLFVPPSYTFMTRECQWGEIVQLGSRAKKAFPDAEIGMYMLIHHFVTGKEIEKGGDVSKHLLDSDEKYRYYTVTCTSFNGRGNESYGVWDGSQIIPHPDYIFLEKKDEETDQGRGEMEKVGSLFVFKEWEPSRNVVEQKLAKMKNQNKELSKSTLTPEVVAAIQKREAEMENITKGLAAKKVLPYKIVAINDRLEYGVHAGDTIYMLNQACLTTIEFEGKEYIVAKSKYAMAVREPSLTV